MKKTVILFGALSLFGTAVANAQSPVQLGVIGGVTPSTLVGDDIVDAKSRSTPFFGGSIVVHGSRSLGFETGVIYVQKGASTDVEDGTGTLKINYLEVPAMVRLGFSLPNSAIRPVVMLGGSFGFKTGCKLAGSSGSASMEIDCDNEIFEGELDVKSFDFGATAGFAVDVPVGTRFIFSPSARYTRGLTNIGDTADNADAKNSAFQAGAAVRFAL